MYKLLTLLGTRPEIIKMSELIKLLDKNFKNYLVHTGQNHDYELNEIFFKDLGLRKPDYFMNANTTSAVDAVQFKMHSGNIDSGTIKLYGIA